jgi:hypothetical protein
VCERIGFATTGAPPALTPTPGIGTPRLRSRHPKETSR